MIACGHRRRLQRLVVVSVYVRTAQAVLIEPADTEYMLGR